MKKIKNKLIIFLFVLLSFVNYTMYSYADSDIYSEYDYYIKNMDVQVEVNDKREYIITETIDAYFNEYRHGLMRNIPLKSSLEGYKVEDIHVSGDNSSVSRDSYEVSIRIGDENKTIIGDKQYIIKYTLKHYDDGQKDADYMYLNLIGTEWDVPIMNFTSNIKYPSQFKFKDMNVTSGYFGETYNELVDYSLETDQIEINSKVVDIQPNQGVTVNISFEEGAFLNAPKDNTNIYIFIIHLLGVVLFVKVLLDVLKSVRDIKNIPIVKGYYPPKNLKSIDVAYIYNGRVTRKTITSMIYSWASDGYIKIEVDDLGKIKLTKLKELEHAYYCEKNLFREIFKYATGTPAVVSGDSLEYKLDKEFTVVKLELEEKYREDERYNLETSKSCRFNTVAAISLILLSVFMKTLLGSNDYTASTFISIMVFMPIWSLLVQVRNYRYNVAKGFIKNLLSVNSIGVLICIIFIFVFGDSLAKDAYRKEGLDLVMDLVPIISLVLTGFIVPKKTPYEQEVYGRIVGFKETIEKMKQSEVDRILVTDPEYFYKILPYAQALNITGSVVKSFNDMPLIESRNYSNIYDYNDINRMNRGMDRFSNNAFVTEPSSSSSSGGDYSGGGCSGGGSGGGGGSSW